MKIEKQNSLRESLNRGLRSDSQDAHLLEPPFYHKAPLFVRVSLGWVRQEHVEITWSVRYAPLATTATRAPYAIYLKYRLRKKQNQGRTKSSRKHLIARNQIHLRLHHEWLHEQDHHRDPTSILILAPELWCGLQWKVPTSARETLDN
jgi:hypothetical protein